MGLRKEGVSGGGGDCLGGAPVAGATSRGAEGARNRGTPRAKTDRYRGKKMSRLREKTTATLLIAIFMISMMTFAVSVMAKKDKDYATIQDGTITDVKGNPITVGYDKWGYNYQAHIFNGWYWNYNRPDTPWTEETLIAAGKSTTWLIMKWSDVWLSNIDRNLDGKLDRGVGPDYASSGVPGAWETNHQFGSYIGEDGEEYKWNYFVKIVCAPEDAYKEIHEDGVEYWHLSDGTEMGTVIWGAYARTLQIYNDQGSGEHGVEYNSAAPTGFGCYK